MSESLDAQEVEKRFGQGMRKSQCDSFLCKCRRDVEKLF